MPLSKLIVFACLTILFCILWYLAYRWQKKSNIKKTKVLGELLFKQGFTGAGDMETIKRALKNSFFTTYTADYISCPYIKYIEDKKIFVFLVQTARNFSTSFSGTRICIFIEGLKDSTPVRFEVNSFPHIKHYQKQKLDYSLSSDFNKKFLIRGNIKDVDSIVSIEIANILSDQYPINMEFIHRSFIMYKDLGLSDIGSAPSIVEDSILVYDKLIKNL